MHTQTDELPPPTDSNDAATQAPANTRHISAAVVGNALEFYDFTTYALFADAIGRTFFAQEGQSPFENLMQSLLAFAVGFVGRPIGAVVLGTLGDRVGRRPAMMLSFVLMGIGIIGIVLTPSYAVIGIAAPALLVFFRLLQGFALGGEVGPTTAFLIESAPPHQRGLIGSWQSASQAIASLAGASVGLLLSYLLTQQQVDDFGWRIAFGIGAVILPFGLWLRRNLPETLHRPEAPLTPASAASTRRAMFKPMLLGLGIIMSFTTSTYVLLYMTTYAKQTLHMSAIDSFAASVASNVAGVVFALLGGYWSDRYGRKPVMISARILFLFAIYPAFSLLLGQRDLQTLIFVTFLLGALSSTSVGVALVCLTESIRKDVRSAGMAIIYAVGVTVFGGLAQPIVAEVMELTGDPMTPAWYMMGAAIVGIVAMSFMPETSHVKLEKGVLPVEVT